MALIGSSATSAQSGNLTSTFLNSLINSVISSQRKPINDLKSKKDQLSIQKAVYSDLKTKLKALGTIVNDMKSDSANLVFDKKTALSSDSAQLTATATSSSANATYNITITQLAKAHRIRSDRQINQTDELNLSGTFEINGQSISVKASDNLQNIASAINNAKYADGKSVSATIVDNHLVIEAGSTGLSNAIVANDISGTILADLGILDGEDFKTTLQSASDASFSINGINVSRGSNTEINDVISGVTLNLLGETEDSKTIKLTVQPDYTSIRSKVSAFVSNLNSAISYLKSKTQTIANTETNTYSRGALTSDSMFSSLRINLVNTLRTKVSSSTEGGLEYLTDVGINIGSNLNISLNTSKLDSAVQNNPNGVIELFDGVMKKYDDLLKPFTEASSSNTLDLYSDSINTKIKNIDKRVEVMEATLKKKEEMLTKQYSSIYIQNIEFTSQQYSLFNTYYSTKV
jgi:flagellar hook-associated protein 2